MAHGLAGEPGADPCKCKIVVHDSRRDRPIVADIGFCPLHKAAPRLLEALKLAEEWEEHERLHGCSAWTCCDPTASALWRHMVDARTAAIAAAKP